MTAKTVAIKPLNITQEHMLDVQKLVKVQNSLSDFSKEFINKDIQTISNETNKIQKFSQAINSILQKMKSYKEECSKTIGQLEKQVSDLNGSINIYERDFKNNNKQSQYKKQIERNQKTYLAEWEKRIQMAAKINVQGLIKIDIQDRKSKANQIFKWIIVTIYGEAQAKFYWPNFKEQVFVRDQGVDFKERLGKVNASNAKQQQKVKTADFLKSFKQIQSCPQLKKVQSQIQQIRRIAEIFLNCYEIARKIRDLEASIQKSRQECREKDEQAMRWKARAEALQDRIKSNKQYLNALNKIENRLSGKTENYTEKQKTAKQIIERLQKNEQIPHLTIDVQEDKRGQCQCTIF